MYICTLDYLLALGNHRAYYSEATEWKKIKLKIPNPVRHFSDSWFYISLLANTVYFKYKES